MQRFRWTTLHRALDVLVLHCSNAQMKSLIEEVGCGPHLDRTPSGEQSTPKLKNLLSKACREAPPRLDTDGNLLSDRLVREAAQRIGNLPEPAPWETAPAERHPVDAAFERSALVDGWVLQDGVLTPSTPVPLEQTRTRLRASLEERGAEESIKRLDQFEKGLDEGHWESANSDARGFLASVFDVVAVEGLGETARDGAARFALQKAGFFRPDPRDASRSLEGKFVSSLFDMLGSEGVHSGATEMEIAVYRYVLCVMTADHFLARSTAMMRKQHA